MSSTALATTSTATSTSRTAAGTSSPLPLRKDATQTPRTPQRQTGQWTHPRMDEVIRRRNATNFDSSNVTTILLSAGLIVLSLFTPTVLYHTCVSNPVSPSALLPHSRTILQNPYPMARSSLPIPALRRLDLPNPHAPQHPHRHNPPLAETRLLRRRSSHTPATQTPRSTTHDPSCNAFRASTIRYTTAILTLSNTDESNEQSECDERWLISAIRTRDTN